MSPFVEKITFSFLIILFFFLCLLIFTKLFGPLELARINSDSSNIFTVDGTGNASATPQTAMVSVTISKTSTSVTDAQQQVNSIASKFTSDIKALGIQDKDIKTTNYSSTPVSPSVVPVPLDNTETSVNSGPATQAIINTPIIPPVTDGNMYTVSENLQIESTSVDTANKVIDTATKDGINTVGGIQFTFSDDEQQKLQNQARTAAIQDAKQKAQEVANESGLHLGRLINVQTNDNSYPIFAAAKADTASGAPSQPTNLQPGQNKITETVTLSYETQ